MESSSRGDAFRWVCLGVAILFGIGLLWLIVDFRNKVISAIDQSKQTIAKVQESVDKVDQRLPSILAEVHNTSETLSSVADDVKLMKRIAGVDSNNTNTGVRGLAVYADDLQQFLAQQAENQKATILVDEIIGSDLKEVDSLPEFLVGLNKEMVLAILPLSKSREEMLYRVCRSSVRRVPCYIQFEDKEPILLEEFIRANHDASNELPAYPKETAAE